MSQACVFWESGPWENLPMAWLEGAGAMEQGGNMGWWLDCWPEAGSLHGLSYQAPPPCPWERSKNLNWYTCPGRGWLNNPLGW